MRLEILRSGFLEPSPSLALGHMEVRINTQISGLTEQLTYLYNFREGECLKSLGTL